MGPEEFPQTPAGEPREPEASAQSPADRLGAHLDSLPYPQRTTALARHARTLTPDAYRELHTALDAGDSEERHRALLMAVSRRDLATVTRALRDPLLRRRALSAAIRLPVPDSALTELALDPVRAVRHDTYRVLKLSRRTLLAAALLPAVRQQHGDADAVLLLPACPADTAGDWLPRLDPPFSALSALARTAPRAVATHIAARFRACAPGAGHRLARTCRALAGTVAARDPHAALTLLEHVPDLLGPQAMCSVLLRPDDALRILRASGPPPASPRLRIPSGPLPPAVRRALAAADDDQVEELTHYIRTATSIRRPCRPAAPDALLMALPPQRRRRAALAQTPGESRRTVPPPASFAALSREDRSAIAATLPQTWFDNPRRAARLAVTLPLADAETVLRRHTDSHDAYTRGMAWPALLACAELDGDPAQYARVVRDCERAWHDRDPIRHAFLAQLAAAGPRFLATLPPGLLSEITLTTVRARDTGGLSFAAVERLLRRFHAASATGPDPRRAAGAALLLAEVVADPRHTGPVRPLAMSPRAARDLWSALEPSLPARGDLQVALAELLAPRLHELPALDARVRRIAVTDDDAALAARAAACWAAPARTREQRCAELVALDTTFACVPLVLRTIATRRTDLVDGVIAAAAAGTTGRLRPRATPWALHVPPGAPGRWLPAQRARWDELHARVAADESLPLRARTDAAEATQDPGALTALAEAAPVPVAAAALTRLGTVPAAVAPGRVTGTVEALLRHAGGGGVKARAAMWSLRRVLAHLPARDAVGLLAPLARADDTPVGSRKEAARLLGTIPGDAARAALLDAWDAPRQHRDVRAALATALLPAVARPEVAARLSERADEPAVRDALVHSSGTARSTAQEAAVVRFLTSLLPGHSDETCRAVCRSLEAWNTDEVEEVAAALAAVVAADRPEPVWDVAVDRLHQLRGRTAADTLARLCEELARRARDGTGEARAEALRRLHGCVRSRWAQTPQPAVRAADRLVPLLTRVGLHADAADLTWRTALDDIRRGHCRTERWDGLLRLLDGHPTRFPVDAHRGDYISADSPRARAALLRSARLLRARGTPTAGALALALVRSGGRATLWVADWRAELDALRAHQDQDTATAALLVRTGARGR